MEQDLAVDVEKAAIQIREEDWIAAVVCSEYELRKGGLVFALCALRHIALATLVRCLDTLNHLPGSHQVRTSAFLTMPLAMSSTIQARIDQTICSNRPTDVLFHRRATHPDSMGHPMLPRAAHRLVRVLEVDVVPKQGSASAMLQIHVSSRSQSQRFQSSLSSPRVFAAFSLYVDFKVSMFICTKNSLAI